jgi:hypothetical protein
LRSMGPAARSLDRYNICWRKGFHLCIDEKY